MVSGKSQKFRYAENIGVMQVFIDFTNDTLIFLTLK